MADNDPTSEGTRAIKAWLGAQEELRRAKDNLNRRECDLKNVESALAKWLLPPDAKVGEKIAVWYGDSLIQGEVCEDRTIITVRSRGKRLALIT